MPVRRETPEVLDEAVAILRDGGLVVTPTCGNYCLVCDPTNPNAIEQSFDVKGRTKFGPLTLALHEVEAVGTYVEYPPGFDPAVLERVWPAEVSFIFEKAFPFPERLTCGHSTIALMFHGPCTLQRLLTRYGGPLGLTSGNLSGQGDIPIGLTKAVGDLGDRVDLIIEAPSADEITATSNSGEHPSNTIVDFTFGRPLLVRVGVLPTRVLLQHFPDLETDPAVFKRMLTERLAATAEDRTG